MKRNTKLLAALLAVVMLVSVVLPILPFTVSAAAALGETPVAGRNYMIVSKASGKAMTVGGNSADNNATIVQMDAEGYASQVWTLQDGGDGTFILVNYFSGKAINIPNNSAEAGTQMIQWNNDGGDNEKFSVSETADGYYRITPKINPSMGLNVEGNSNANGAGIIQWGYGGADNEKWSFLPVSSVQDNPIPEEPDRVKAIDKWLEMFYYVDGNGRGQLRNEPDNGFWTDAEMLEVMIDAYAMLGDAKYKTVVSQYFDGIIARRGTNWSWNGFNDDVMWMVIASVRAYLLTGEQKYLSAAIENFDMCYNRAWDTSHLGGGLWWTTDNNTKNACVNGPGAIAAYLLGEATGNEAYYAKAQAIIDWEAEYFLQDDGAIWDSIPLSGDVNTWASTYNQGTFIGACAMLYKRTGEQKYFDWAKSAADYASTMGDGTEGLLNREQNSGDLIGFKGILGRWLGYFARECDVNDYDEWMYNNAKAAWNNRNSDDLMWTEFGRMTVENIQNTNDVIDGTTTAKSVYAAWGCSSAVAWLLNYTGEVVIPQVPVMPETPDVLGEGTHEMENGSIAGGQIVANAGASNGQHVGNLGGGTNGTVTFNIASEAAGKATISIYYATWSVRTVGVTVNGTLYTYDCPSTGDWTTVGAPVSIEAELAQGNNTIVFGGVNGGDAPNLDKFEIVLPEVQAVYEMESGTVNGGQIVNNASASNGQHVGNLGGGTNGTVSFNVESDEAGKAIIDLYYATWSARTVGVTVNGTLYTYNCPSTGDWNTVGAPVSIEVNVVKGNNTIVFGGVDGGDAPNLDKFELTMSELAYEMESGTVNGGQIVNNANASNGQHVGNLGGGTNGTVSFNAEIDEAGKATVRLYYATWSARTVGVTVNGTLYTYDCPSTGDWTTVGTPVSIDVELAKGNNTIVFGGVNGGDAPNLDKFEIVLP